MSRPTHWTRAVVVLALVALGSWSAELAAQNEATPESLLGLLVRDLDKQEASSLGVEPSSRGVVVREVEIGGPAAAAGLEGGDVITHVDDRSVSNSAAFRRAVERRHPGDKVRLRAWRAGRERRFTVRLGQEGPAPEVRAHLFSTPRRALLPGVQLGVQCVDLSNPQLAAYFGVERGVLVTDVVEASGAEAAGIQGGDVLLAVDGKAVHDVASLRSALQRFDAGDKVELRLRRAGQERTQRVELRGDNGFFAASTLPWVEGGRLLDGSEELRRELQALRRELEQLRREWESERP